MPKLNELPSIAQANEEDLVLLQQGGGDKQATRGQLLADRVQSVDSIEDLPSATGSGKTVLVNSYYANTTTGGGTFVDKLTGRHDGVTFIDPSRSAEIGTPDYYVDSGTDVAGWKRGLLAMNVYTRSSLPTLTQEEVGAVAYLQDSSDKYPIHWDGSSWLKTSDNTAA